MASFPLFFHRRLKARQSGKYFVVSLKAILRTLERPGEHDWESRIEIVELCLSKMKQTQGYTNAETVERAILNSSNASCDETARLYNDPENGAGRMCSALEKVSKSMTETFKRRIRQLVGLPVRQKANGAALKSATVPRPVRQERVDQDTASREAAVNDAAPPIKDAAIDRLDLERKIASMRCDLHPLYFLRDAAIEILAPKSTVATRTKGWCCTKQSCNRHYLQEFGYFHSTAGEHPGLGQVELKSRCVTHESVYMTVAKVNGSFVWACLEFGCTKTAPYHEPLPAVLS